MLLTVPEKQSPFSLGKVIVASYENEKNTLDSKYTFPDGFAHVAELQRQGG